jgi:hypothetical protein
MDRSAAAAGEPAGQGETAGGEHEAEVVEVSAVVEVVDPTWE